MRRRVLLGGCALAALLGFVTAAPVSADHTSGNSSLITWVDKAGKAAEKLVNPAIDDVPTPDGWHDRSVCVGDEGMDRAFCVYFPWPI